jgi:hypothetical protein
MKRGEGDLILILILVLLFARLCSLSYYRVCSVPGGIQVWWTNYNNSTIEIDLLPQSGTSLSFSLSLVENVPPANYTLLIEVKDRNEVSHTQSTVLKLPVQCQKPKPVWDLMANEVLSDLGTPLGSKYN